MLEARMKAHWQGEVPSTTGANPVRSWVSSPRLTRHDAANFEAVLKSFRDQRSMRFGEITGLDPIPYSRRRKEVGLSTGKGFVGTIVSMAVCLGEFAKIIFQLDGYTAKKRRRDTYWQPRRPRRRHQSQRRSRRY